MEREELLAQFLDALFIGGQMLRQAEWVARSLAEVAPLYQNELRTLHYIGSREGLSLGALSQAMFRTKGATSVMLTKLERKGLVLRGRDADDVRRYSITLTPLGHQVCREHIRQDRRFYEYMLENSGVEADQLQQATDTLLRLVACCAAIPPETIPHLTADPSPAKK